MTRSRKFRDYHADSSVSVIPHVSSLSSLLLRRRGRIPARVAYTIDRQPSRELRRGFPHVVVQVYVSLPARSSLSTPVLFAQCAVSREDHREVRHRDTVLLRKNNLGDQAQDRIREIYL